MPNDADGTFLVVSMSGREVALGRLCDDDPMVAVEAVARLHLAAKRRGITLGIRTTDPTLRSMLDAVGLAHLVQR